MRALMSLCLMMCLTACSTPSVVTKTEVVTEEVITFREVPGEYTTEIRQIERPVQVTYGGLVEMLALAMAKIDIANGRFQAIRSLGEE